LDWPFAINIGPGLPLEPGAGYDWRISVDGETDENWTLPFVTAAQPKLQAA
jgi:hypothetical protein